MDDGYPFKADTPFDVFAPVNAVLADMLAEAKPARREPGPLERLDNARDRYVDTLTERVSVRRCDAYEECDRLGQVAALFAAALRELQKLHADSHGLDRLSDATISDAGVVMAEFIDGPGVGVLSAAIVAALSERGA